METLFFSPGTIKEFLHLHKSEIETFDELLIGLVLANFHLDSGVKKVSIGFSIKSDIFRTMPQLGKTNLVLIEALYVIAKENDTPIDIVVAFNDISSMPIKSNHGMSYQIKRFRKQVDGDATEPLIEFLNKKIPQKYAPVRACLIIVPEKIKSINWATVKNEFISDGFPFESVLFFVISESKPFIGEIWPNPGMNSYDIKRLLW